MSSPSFNILKLIIDNNPTKLSHKTIEQRFKSFVHDSNSYLLQNNARPNVRDLFLKYNILYGSNSSTTIKTYLPKMRPVSSSIKGYSKYKLNHQRDKAMRLFNDKDVELLFKAKCRDLGIEPNDKARTNFVNALDVNMKDRKLDLREFNIGVSFVKALQRILRASKRKSGEIAQIKLGKNPLGDNSLKYIMSIVTSSKAIAHLDLSSANISYKKGNLIFNALAQHRSLISLDVSSKDSTYRNRLLSHSMEAAKTMLMSNNYLEYLDLSGNNIRDEGFKLLMEGIIGNGNGHIVYLNLSHNDITHDGMKHFNMINRSMPLEQLHLSENPIKSEGLITLCNKVSCLQSMGKLHIAECGIDFQGLLSVVQTYGYGSHRLDTLVLDNNRIDSKRFEMLRELFKNFNVSNLSFRNCDLSELSVSYIGDFLKTNEVIKSISLSSNKITDTAFMAYNALPECTCSLEKIDLSNNLICDASAMPFVKALTDNCTMREINLSNNQIQNETAGELLKTLETNKQLLAVNLSMNFIKGELIDKVNVLLKENKRMSKARYVPGLKASIKTNKIDKSEYDLFKGQISLSKKQQVKLASTMKEDEVKYEHMKEELHKKLSVLLAQLANVDNQLQSITDEIEMNVNEQHNEDTQFEALRNEMNTNLTQMSKDVNKLEMEQIKLNKDISFNSKDYAEEIKRYTGNLKLLIEKIKLAEANKKRKLNELKQKKLMLTNMSREGNEARTANGDINENNALRSDAKDKLRDVPSLEGREQGKKKKRGISAKRKGSKSKKKNKEENAKGNNNNSNINRGNSINAVRTSKTMFSGFPLNNSDIYNVYQVQYDTSLKRNDNDQTALRSLVKMEWNSTSVSKYKETDLTSPKQSLLNTVSNNN